MFTHLKKALCLAGCFAGMQSAYAAAIEVAAGSDLQQAIARANAGDTLRLAAGQYRGQIIVDKPLTIEGPEGGVAKIEGTRTGRTIEVSAPDVVLRRLTITRSGLSLPAMDAGVFLAQTALRAQVANNQILENSVGVYIHGAADSRVSGNRIVGDAKLRVNERGNGVTVWNAPGAQVTDNDISEGRDGIFSNTSTRNLYRNNRFTRLRYAVHYMYTNDSEVSGNVSDGNNIGYAIMFSERLKVADNIALNSRDQGLMLNYANHSSITGNVIDKAEKCVFIYNANHNTISGNHFENCEMGIHFTAAAEGNRIFNNAFINNQSQVKYVGTRYIEWSDGQRGNYWSDNSAFDLNGDGIADTAYRPNGIIDQIVWRAPVARLLLNSPAVSIVKWAQSQFPAILPGGVADSKPLMKPPANPTLNRYYQNQHKEHP
jgi:nitrous oxidase accessory protein